jgi:hypothetical protein
MRTTWRCPAPSSARSRPRALAPTPGLGAVPPPPRQPDRGLARGCPQVRALSAQARPLRGHGADRPKVTAAVRHRAVLFQTAANDAVHPPAGRRCVVATRSRRSRPRSSAEAEPVSTSLATRSAPRRPRPTNGASTKPAAPRSRRVRGTPSVHVRLRDPGPSPPPRRRAREHRQHRRSTPALAPGPGAPTNFQFHALSARPPLPPGSDGAPTGASGRPPGRSARPHHRPAVRLRPAPLRRDADGKPDSGSWSDDDLYGRCAPPAASRRGGYRSRSTSGAPARPPSPSPRFAAPSRWFRRDPFLARPRSRRRRSPPWDNSRPGAAARS